MPKMIYWPVVQIIRDSTLLQDFPGRTESDLYVWLSQYGPKEWHLLARMLTGHFKEGSIEKLTRQVRRLLGHNKQPPLAGLTEGVIVKNE